MLLVELFRIHQQHWDEIRSCEIPSFKRFRADIRKLVAKRARLASACSSGDSDKRVNFFKVRFAEANCGRCNHVILLLWLARSDDGARDGGMA